MSRTGKVQVPGAQAAVVEPEVVEELEQVVEPEVVAKFTGPASDDAAIEAGQAGRAHKIEKPRMPLAPADLGGMPDVTRPPTATINANKEMTVSQAMALDRTGKLQRAVMTSSGWYVPRNSQREQSERRRNGQPPLVEID